MSLYLRRFNMAFNTYTLTLTPTARNMASEGSLDTAVLNGVSLQRTGYITTSASGNMQAIKVTEAGDGTVFTDAPQSLTDLSWVVS
jgi:hypothetical protein